VIVELRRYTLRPGDGREIEVPARFAVTRTERLRLTPTSRSALY